MAEPLESGVHSKLSLSELGSRIKTRMIKVAECEQAIARLGDTIEDECMSIIKTRRRYFQKKISRSMKNDTELWRGGLT